MKPFMGTDFTENKKNTHRNGGEFLVQKPSAESLEAMEKSVGEMIAIMNKRTAPTWLVIGGAVLVAPLLMLVDALLGRLSLSPESRKTVFIIVAVVMCFAAWLLMKWTEKAPERIEKNKEFASANAKLKEQTLAMLEELGVPDSARLAEVLVFAYKRGNGEEISLWNASNPSVWAFADDTHLYLANAEGKYSFPLAQMTAIRTVSKTVRIPVSKKEGNVRKDEFETKGSIIEATSDRPVGACSLEFNHNGETWGIYFPNYERNVFEELTGLSAEE